MSTLDRLFTWLREHDKAAPPPDADTTRTDEIIRRVDDQWSEVHRHGWFVDRTIRENHLAQKIATAIREH